MTLILENYMARVKEAKDGQHAFQLFSQAAEKYGFDQIVYTLATDHPSMQLTREHALAYSYPTDWVAHYKANNLLDVDPVHAQVLSSSVPFLWSELQETKKLDTSSKLLMNQARDAGLKSGLGIPLYGLNGEIAAMGVARSEEVKKEKYEDLAIISFMATFFHETYKKSLSPDIAIELTIKEKEVLLWAAEGKTDDEIATILNLSLPTIRYRWGRIFEKLGVYKKTHAVAKAIMRQVIRPYTLFKNYQF